ncbi:MAG: BamA/TamA family outer membrane protein [bacterium]|nr:BamA/TamA family outer membrane protein [bacterium]
MHHKILRLLLTATVILVCAHLAQARWFILPGAYYTEELGWVASCAFIAESIEADRFEARFEYSGEDEGMAALRYFQPRQEVELTFIAEFRSSQKHVFSDLTPSLQDELFNSNRQATLLAFRCDFPKPNGLFYGFETAYRLYRFKGDIETGESPDEFSLTDLYYSEGSEYSVSLRTGLEARDNRDYTTYGHHLLWQLDLGKTYQPSGSDLLLRNQIDGREYVQLYRDWTILALNLRGGIIHHQVPYFSQFKLGGVDNLRGFPEDRYYGNAFYLFRTELRQTVLKDVDTQFPILKKIYPKYSAGFVLFTDAGDLWRDSMGWWGRRQGIGAGLRIILPPSVVAAVDLAKPIDVGGWNFYINLRQSF